MEKVPPRNDGPTMLDKKHRREGYYRKGQQNKENKDMWNSQYAHMHVASVIEKA